MKQQASIGARIQPSVREPGVSSSVASSLAASSWQWEMRMHLFILIPPQHFRCAINARTGTMRHITICIHVNTYPFIEAAPHIWMCIYALSCALCPVCCVLGQGNRWSLFAHKGTKTINANDGDVEEENDDNDEAATMPLRMMTMIMTMVMAMARTWTSTRTRRRRAHQTPLLPQGPRLPFGHERGCTQTRNALKIHNFQIIFNDFKYT